MIDEPASSDPALQHLEFTPLCAALLPRTTFAPPGTRATCALSGGADSTALVALAVAADLDVSVVHVDHRLRSDSADDAELAAATALHFGLPFRAVIASIDPGPNLEARARAARRRIVGADALTGHTADDQAETVLLNLIRGSGATGLGGMRPSHTKPILGLRRAETVELCTRLGLDVANDPTNTDPSFRRNRIRHEMMPLLDDIGERDTAPLLSRSSNLLRDDDDLLTTLADDLDPTDARALSAAPLPLARRAVRRWLIAHISSDDSEHHPPAAAAVERVLEVARGDATGCDVTNGWRVERSQQHLRLFSTTRSKR